MRQTEPLAFGGAGYGAISGYLRITVNQARLAKNYGLTRMDPYCRIRIGHAVLETPAAYNGSKNPRWNQVLHCQLPRGIPGMHFEIFNERYLAPDNRIGWGYFEFPQEMMNGDTVEEWLPLSGPQGEEKEGVLNVILTFQPFQSPVSYYSTPPTMQPMGMPGAQMYYHGGYPPNYQQPAPGTPPTARPPPRTPQISEQSVKQLKEMFPQMDDEVLKSVLVAKNGNVEQSINELLSMS
jgi:toll-interacting protein